MAQSNNKRNYNSWNNTETEKFIEGVKKYSRDFKEIATLVGTKEEKQVFFFIESHSIRFAVIHNGYKRFVITITDC